MRLFSLLIALIIAGPGAAAADLRENACVVAAQRAFVGDWSVTSSRRISPTQPGVATETSVERNLWIEPLTLVIQVFDDQADPAPKMTINEILTESGIDLTITEGLESQSISLQIDTQCSIDPSGLISFQMAYERDIGGAPWDMLNIIEIGTDVYSLERRGRPKGSTQPRELLDLQQGQALAPSP